MLNINLICVGKFKEQYLRDASAEYQKRLGAFCRLEITELTPSRLADNPSPAQIEIALNREGNQIIEKIPQSTRAYTLCIEGKQLTSEEFSAELQTAAVRGAGSIAFVVGGSYGLSEEVKRRANFKLSMSKMTFPHQLARVMLLEQLYRAFMINNGGKYHK